MTQPEGGESGTPRTDAIFLRHIAEAKRFSNADLQREGVRQVKELLQHSSDLERELLTLRQSVERLTGENAHCWETHLEKIDEQAQQHRSALDSLRKEAAGLREILNECLGEIFSLCESAGYRVLPDCHERGTAALSARQQNGE